MGGWWCPAGVGHWECLGSMFREGDERGNSGQGEVGGSVMVE